MNAIKHSIINPKITKKIILKLDVYRQVSACHVHLPEAASYRYKSLKFDL